MTTLDRQIDKTRNGTVNLGEVTLESGKVLDDVAVAYERIGNPDLPVIFVCHALTGNQSAAGTQGHPGWWSGLVGYEKTIDTEEFQVITFNVLGGCDGTTGPTSIDDKTGHSFQTDFPFITIRDMVTVHYSALRVLGIERLAGVIGGSLGGMQVLEFGIMYPDFVDKVICLAATPVFSDYAVAFNAVSRKAIMDDLNWREGWYSSDNPPDKGLGTARMLAMLTYRTAGLFDNRFSREIRDGWGSAHDEKAFQVESYLDYHGAKFDERFDANSYLYLLKAMDSHDIGRDRGGVEKALEMMTPPLLAIGFEGDLLYSPIDIENMVNTHQRSQPKSRFYEHETIFGHDGFLVEFDRWGHWIKEWLNDN